MPLIYTRQIGAEVQIRRYAMEDGKYSALF